MTDPTMRIAQCRNCGLPIRVTGDQTTCLPHCPKGAESHRLYEISQPSLYHLFEFGETFGVSIREVLDAPYAEAMAHITELHARWIAGNGTEHDKRYFCSLKPDHELPMINP